ncbi:hypothetical protein [Rhizobium mayense]|uniref:DUF1134 domain-containing protein n=1 Tax=Rhizobium mayense TaxID=1312184 RepID=A0ABT7JXQ3_9HYPH|nr:hypothetical protein [Rhizobium mayense]MDL2400535.1 hypothetical protein [Rhizobium mayense]
MTTRRTFFLAASAAAVAAAMLAATGCSTSSPVPMTVPTAQSIARLAPSGTVSLTETFVGGVGAGQGVLTFRGQTYPFKLLGTVIGPGSVSRLEVAGDVYKLNNLSDFPGPYAQGTGPVGVETSGNSELWLQNKAGVIMHLKGKDAGVTLSLGRDEIIIEMSQ